MENRRSKDGYWSGATCPICGKEFFPTPEWAWNNGKSYLKRVCSYHCHLEARRKKPTKWDAKKAELMKRNEEIYRLYKEGTAREELSEMFGLSDNRIWKIITEMKSLEDIR